MRKYFFDTNIIIYANDSRDPEKQNMNNLGVVVSHDARDFIYEIQRVLRPGGRCMLTTPNPEYFKLRLLNRSVLDDPAHLSEVQWCAIASGGSGLSGEWAQCAGNYLRLYHRLAGVFRITQALETGSPDHEGNPQGDPASDARALHVSQGNDGELERS